MPQQPPKNSETVETTRFGRVVARPIEQEMSASYIDYAMSVIVMRALPDVRDGLKPVHRRILYAMWQIGLRANAKFRKSATVVGEVLGKFHPHGDTAVYDSLVRLAQDFSMRMPLVHGQGNFGSMDGDAAAAMRYTECKLTKLAEELLVDIDKETVAFIPNFDAVHQEPTVLPSRVPNLLLNGAVGIAVGMATSIPPHNLGELCDALVLLIEKPDADIEEIMEHIKGPDLPTGGLMYDAQAIRAAYSTGRGPIVMRGRAEIVEEKEGYQIVITEIPYLVNKATLIEKIAQLVHDKKVDGIRDLRDESDRTGIRVVIDLKKGTYPQKILNRLYQLTQLQETFHLNMLALVDGIQPRVLSLKMILEEFLKHREVTVQRRTTYELSRAEERAHILEGLVMALEKIDAVIKTIKRSRDKNAAKVNLMKQFRMTERQAIAILEMKLQQLANLERLAVEEELKEKRKLISELKKILASRAALQNVVRKEIHDIKTQYASPRRTEIVATAIGQFRQEDLIPKEHTVVIITQDGYIKRVPPETFKKQHRGGKGVVGLTTKEEDTVEEIFTTNTHADVLFFTTRGRLFRLKAYDIPTSSRTAKGQALVNFLQLGAEERVSATVSLDDLAKTKYLMMVTKHGVVKKTAITDFRHIRQSGLIAIRLRPGDELMWVKPSSGHDHVLLISNKGQAIRFHEKNIRPMGRVASGVRGLRLKNGSIVMGIDVIPAGGAKGDQLLVIMDHGYGKRTSLTQYKVQGRGGSGVKTAKVTLKTGDISAAFVVGAHDQNRDVVIISSQGQVIRAPLTSVNVLGRATQGVRMMRFKDEKDSVASVTLVS